MSDNPCKKLEEKVEKAKTDMLNTVKGTPQVKAETRTGMEEFPVYVYKGPIEKSIGYWEKNRIYEKAIQELATCRKKYPKT